MAKKIVNNVLELPEGKIADEILSQSDLLTNIDGIDYYVLEVSVLKPEELKFVQELADTPPQIGWYYKIMDGSALLKPLETEEDVKAVSLIEAPVRFYSLKS